jgi:23S rRNA pseudouridine955/2504/2580 synthase
MMKKELITGTDDVGRRLDRILRRVFPDMPLSLIHRLLRKGRVMVDGVPSGAADRIAGGARILVQGEVLEHEDGRPSPKQRAVFESPSEVPSGPAGSSPGLCILREGDGLLIVNKPAGLAVHGSGLSCLDTLVRSYLRDKLPPSLSFRPGPLHRLDQGSSGVIVFSTSLEGARTFSALMRERRLRKTYLALVGGRIKGEEIWEEVLFRDTSKRKTLAITGEQAGRSQAKPARTRVFPLAVRPLYSLVALEIETGRTHQIRSQAAFHGHPLAGDRKYGGSFQRGGLLLHALSLGFPTEGLPLGLEELRGETVRAPLPEPFLRRIQEIFGGCPPLP